MSTPPATPAGLTHGCARCGAPVPLDVGLCERCNPLGLRDSAASQVHGTVIATVGLAIVALALLAHFAVSGIGPFPAEVVGVRTDRDGLAVSVTVTNSGTSSGSTTCRISDPAVGGGAAAFVQSPRVGPGSTITFESSVTGLGTAERPLDVECSAP